MRYYEFNFAGIGYFVSDIKNAELMKMVLNQGGQLLLASSVSALGIVIAVKFFEMKLPIHFFTKTQGRRCSYIAGDSSTGKTTLANSLTDLFGEKFTAIFLVMIFIFTTATRLCGAPSHICIQRQITSLCSLMR